MEKNRSTCLSLSGRLQNGQVSLKLRYPVSPQTFMVAILSKSLSSERRSMKKILVIDLDKFEELMAETNLETTARITCVNVLLQSKQDVVEFEAEIETETIAESIPEGDFASPKKIVGVPSGFADGTKLKVFVVVRKEKQ